MKKMAAPTQIFSFSISLVSYQSDIQTLKKTLISLIDEIQRIEDTKQISTSEITIIDNYSNKEYRASLKELINEIKKTHSQSIIKLQALDQNLGFGKGHNVAIFNSNSDFHLIMNPDVTIPELSLLSGLNTLASNQTIALVTPIIKNEHGEEARSHSINLKFFDIWLRSVAPKFIKSFFSARLFKSQNVPINILIPQHSNVVFSGCMMLFRTKTLQEIGGFSEKFFLYFEDYDLSLKTLNHSPAIIDSGFIINHSGGGANRKGLKHWFYFIQSAIIFFYLSKY